VPGVMCSTPHPSRISMTFMGGSSGSGAGRLSAKRGSPAAAA
jgi:hypothetical protein